MPKKVTRKAAPKTARKTSRTRVTGLQGIPGPIRVQPGSEQALSKAQVISELAKSPHGSLQDYLPVGLRAATEDPDFFAHLVGWNHKKGEIRDAQVALPVIAMKTTTDPEYLENAVAHLADLDPRRFLQAVEFARQIKAPSRLTRRLVKRYLKDLEGDYFAWERAGIQHRDVLQSLYAKFHIPTGTFDGILFGQDYGKGFTGDRSEPKREVGGKFRKLAQLKTMSDEEAAGTILEERLPFLIVRGYLGKRLKSPVLVQALIKGMTPTQLVNNMKWLERLGVQADPALRGALTEALSKAGKSKGKASLKATKAAEALEASGDTQLAGKLRDLQEKQLDNLRGIDGNWLVGADVSGSMHSSIEYAQQITAVLTRMVKGSVWLVFFNDTPRFFDMTGKTLEEIQQLTRGVRAGGGTRYSCVVDYAKQNKLLADGIAFIGDGEDSGGFALAYQSYCKAFGIEPSVYMYDVPGGRNSLVAAAKASHVDVQQFDLRTSKVDYHSLPNIVQTMRVGKYSLLDEVLGVSFKKLDQVLTNTQGQEVLGHATRSTEVVQSRR